MVTKLWPLCKVKLLKNNVDKAVVRSPEKAGVGGSTPSLATTFSVCIFNNMQRSLVLWESFVYTPHQGRSTWPYLLSQFLFATQQTVQTKMSSGKNAIAASISAGFTVANCIANRQRPVVGHRRKRSGES